MKLYDKIHKTAKSIVFCGVVACLIAAKVSGLIVLDIVAVAIWFFGVNPVAYLLETFLHVKHQHNRI